MISDDQARLLSSMLVCIPFSYVIPKLPNRLSREIYSLILGTLVQFYIYGTDVLMIYALHVLVYFLTMINPKSCGKHVTIVSLVLLSIYHIYRMIVDYGGWTMDISVIMMSNVNKYSLFAFSYQDGHTPLNKLSKEQTKERLEKLPSFFRFLGYCQFLPASPISIAFPYKVYDDYMELRNQYTAIPSPWKMVLHDFGFALLMVPIYVFHMLYFPLSELQSPEFATKGCLHIIVFSFVSIVTLRFKYYFGWKLSLVPIHASGISYQKHENGTSDWKLIQTCNPLKVEQTVHVREKIANWNMTCQEWLRKCVYERCHFKNKIFGQLLTFMVSAFWHGYYGGYYISFFLWFCQVYVSQLVFKEAKKEKSPFRKLYKSLGIVGVILLWLGSNVTFSVSGLFFQVLSLTHSF